MLRILLVLVLAIVTQSLGLAQGNFSWSGSGPDGNFSTPSNWQSSLVPTSGGGVNLTFGSNTVGAVFQSVAAFDASTPTSGSTPAYELSRLSFENLNTPITLNNAPGGPAIRFVPSPTNANSSMSSIGGTYAPATNQPIVWNVPILTANTGILDWFIYSTTSFTVNSSVNITNAGFYLYGDSPTTFNGPVSMNTAPLVVRAPNVTFNGVIGNSAGAAGLEFYSPGTLTLSAANTFTGQLSLGFDFMSGPTSTVRLAGGDNRLNPALTLQFNYPGRLDLNGTNQQLARITSSVAVNGGARIINTSPTTSTFTYAPTSASTLSVTLGENGANNFNFVYNPPTPVTTTLTSSISFYYGSTTVSNGTLALSDTATIANSRRINLDANGILDVTGLRGGYNYEISTSSFLVKDLVTVNGQGTVLGNLYFGSNSTILAGYGSATESINIKGLVNMQYTSLAASGARIVVVAQDQPGNTRSNQIIITNRDSSSLGRLNLLSYYYGGVAIELRNGGGLQQGVAYKMAIASAPVISRNDITVSSVAGGENYTFAASDFLVFASGFTITNVGLTAESGVLYLSFTPVPEPTTVLALAGLGLVGVRLRYRYRQPRTSTP